MHDVGSAGEAKRGRIGMERENESLKREGLAQRPYSACWSGLELQLERFLHAEHLRMCAIEIRHENLTMVLGFLSKFRGLMDNRGVTVSLCGVSEHTLRWRSGHPHDEFETNVLGFGITSIDISSGS